MTTFTMQDLNNIPVTKEEDEAMDALSRLGAGVPLLNPMAEVPPNEDTLSEARQKLTDFVLATTPTPPTLDEIVNAISAQLQLLASIIKEKQGKSSDGNPSQSLQECVDTTLQQAEWFKEMVDERAEELVEYKDFDYQIESSVESWFDNSFSLDDHVDITAEVESKVEDIAEDLLKDMVEERLAEIVSNKLQNLRITFD
jgi:hypothetical protein